MLRGRTAAIATFASATRLGMELNQVRNHFLHAQAIHNHVYLTVFQQILSSLEVRRQLLANRLLNNAPSRKSNPRAGFSDDDIPEHRE
jgi:hypothetical protein